MNRDFLIDEIFFLLKKYIIQRKIERTINEKNKSKHLIMENILWCDIYQFLYF